MYNIEPIEHPIDPRLVTKAEALQILSVTLTTLNIYLGEGRLTSYPITPHCTLLDRREVEILKAARR
ncbi:hypothetical protein ACN9MI_18815 [Rhodococcoides fascians]|uniref:hypothetical protein n=1 Tax=Nocardiaceae TaxID=85025 RepID=UPI00344E5777